MPRCDTIRYEVSEGLTRLTLDRPDRRNGMSNRMVRETHEVLTETAADPSLRVLLSTGKGRSRCPGADLNWATAGEHDGSKVTFNQCREF